MENEIFSYCRGVHVRSDELTRKIIFRSSFYVIINQHKIFDKKLRNMITPKNSWFNSNWRPRWIYNRGLFMKYINEILLFIVIDDQSISQHAISDQKRPNLDILFKNIK